VDKVDAARLCCSIPLDLLHQGGPNASDQQEAIRGHGHEQLGRINSVSDKYAH
jgi:hypothetical protein